MKHASSRTNSLQTKNERIQQNHSQNQLLLSAYSILIRKLQPVR